MILGLTTCRTTRCSPRRCGASVSSRELAGPSTPLRTRVWPSSCSQIRVVILPAMGKARPSWTRSESWPTETATPRSRTISKVPFPRDSISLQVLPTTKTTTRVSVQFPRQFLCSLIRREPLGGPVSVSKGSSVGMPNVHFYRDLDTSGMYDPQGQPVSTKSYPTGCE